MNEKYNEVVRAAFEQIIHERDIDHLIHFTDIRNLSSILENGILPYKDLVAHKTVHGYGNGDVRADGNLDANCCSVQHPNWGLFSSKQGRTKADYAFLILSTDIILNKRCSFYPENAAKGWMSRAPVKKYSHSWAFEAMFDDTTGKDREGLDKNMTTDPSAEVHVFGKIEPEYIEEIVIENQTLKNSYAKKHPDFMFVDFWPEQWI